MCKILQRLLFLHEHASIILLHYVQMCADSWWLWLTWRCEDIWLFGDVTFIIDVDNGGPQSDHTLPFAHSAGVQI